MSWDIIEPKKKKKNHSAYLLFMNLFFVWFKAISQMKEASLPTLKISNVWRCDVLNHNTENKLVKRVLVPVNSEMIGIKSQVNKDFTIQFSIKSRKVKAPNRKIQTANPTSTRCFFLAGSITLNDPHETGYFIVIRRFILSRMKC